MLNTSPAEIPLSRRNTASRARPQHNRSRDIQPGYVEFDITGSEGGSRKRTGREAGTAPRSDPYTHFAGCPKIAVFAVMDLVTRKWIT
ncbi:MAG: hypothetical protein M3065_03295, partial [Actinomycetota bacterium]|nr:hypothetical protein [Actinomycetota bacterium]